MPVKLLTSGGGGVNLVPSSSIASDVTVTVPSKSGTTVLTDVADNIGIAATGANYITMSTNGSERMRLDSSGNLLVGTTSSGVVPNGLSLTTNAGGGYSLFYVGHPSGTGSGASYAVFRYNDVTIGNISQNGTAAVSYNTSSDYRLKENIQPMTGALATVAQLNPVRYTWKADGSAGQGFIAHELQAVVPDCVTGEKDAVDADGKPVYQGIDTSFLVATLTAAIQEQQAIIQSLTARIEALEYTKQGE